jgi:hypothetical protein
MIANSAVSATSNIRSMLQLQRSKTEPCTNTQQHSVQANRPPTRRMRSDPGTVTREKITPVEPPSSPTGWCRFAPEIRNIIYPHSLLASEVFAATPSVDTVGGFKLPERMNKPPRSDVVTTLRSLSFVSRTVRREARTFFYARNMINIDEKEYEYLPLFVGWLEALGAECRALLRDVWLYGHMWYRPSSGLTERLHELVRECRNARTVELCLNVRHLCESNLPAPNKYLYHDPVYGPCDGLLPEVDVSGWLRTISSLPKVLKFIIELVLSVDHAEVSGRRGSNVYMGVSSTQGTILAKDIDKRLKMAIQTKCKRPVKPRVIWTDRIFGDYHVPWAAAIEKSQSRKQARPVDSGDWCGNEFRGGRASGYSAPLINV